MNIRTFATVLLATAAAGAILVGCSSTPAPGTPAASVTAAQQQSSYSFPYRVTQGTDSTELEIRDIVMDPDNNSNWGSGNQHRDVTFAACEFNNDTQTQNNTQFNCNIAFADGISQSYWVNFSGSSYIAERRTAN